MCSRSTPGKRASGIAPDAADDLRVGELHSANGGMIVAVDCHAHVMRRDAPLAPDRHSAPKRDCTAEEYLPGSCTRELTCLSRGIWERVQAAILSVLDSTSLQDLLTSEALQHAAAAHFVPLETLRSEFAHA